MYKNTCTNIQLPVLPADNQKWINGALSLLNYVLTPINALSHGLNDYGEYVKNGLIF